MDIKSKMIKVGQRWIPKKDSIYTTEWIVESVNEKAKIVSIRVDRTDHVYRVHESFSGLMEDHELDPVYKAINEFDKDLEELLGEDTK